MFEKFKAQVQAYRQHDREAIESLIELEFECRCAEMAAPNQAEVEDMQSIALSEHYDRIQDSAERLQVDRMSFTLPNVVGLFLSREKS